MKPKNIVLSYRPRSFKCDGSMSAYEAWLLSGTVGDKLLRLEIRFDLSNGNTSRYKMFIQSDDTYLEYFTADSWSAYRTCIRNNETDSAAEIIIRERAKEVYIDVHNIYTESFDLLRKRWEAFLLLELFTPSVTF